MKIVKTSVEPWTDSLQRGAYSQRRKKLGGDGFSSGLWELAPGKKSFPFHKHSATEEALFVISGNAQVRSASGLTEIGPGDFVHFTPGEDAHQLINSGSAPLLYIAIGVSKGLDVTELPDSGKVNLSFGGKSLAFKTSDAIGFFDGEPDA